MNRQAFTLIELLVVVLIIGILASVALPQYQKAVEKSRAAEGMTIARTIATANVAYYNTNGTYSQDLELLDIEIPGTLVNNYGYGVNAIKTKNFTCRAASSNGFDKAIAYCNRFPVSNFYGIGKLADGTFFCHGYNTLGQQICQSFGTRQVDIGENAHGYAFN